MKTKFDGYTRGPWKWYRELNQQDGTIIALMPENPPKTHNTVMLFHSNVDAPGTEDGNLIRIAPEMLEELKACRQVLADLEPLLTYDPVFPRTGNKIKKRIAAIDKLIGVDNETD